MPPNAQRAPARKLYWKVTVGIWASPTDRWEAERELVKLLKKVSFDVNQSIESVVDP